MLYASAFIAIFLVALVIGINLGFWFATMSAAENTRDDDY